MLLPSPPSSQFVKMQKLMATSENCSDHFFVSVSCRMYSSRNNSEELFLSPFFIENQKIWNFISSTHFTPSFLSATYRFVELLIALNCAGILLFISEVCKISQNSFKIRITLTDY